MCPGLVPLRTLADLKAVIMCGYYDDGDGVLGLWYENSWKPQHLYRTDSGHYLLRVDNTSSHKSRGAQVQKTVQ